MGWHPFCALQPANLPPSSSAFLTAQSTSFCLFADPWSSHNLGDETFHNVSPAKRSGYPAGASPIRSGVRFPLSSLNSRVLTLCGAFVLRYRVEILLGKSVPAPLCAHTLQSLILKVRVCSILVVLLVKVHTSPSSPFRAFREFLLVFFFPSPSFGPMNCHDVVV